MAEPAISAPADQVPPTLLGSYWRDGDYRSRYSPGTDRGMTQRSGRSRLESLQVHARHHGRPLGETTQQVQPAGRAVMLRDDLRHSIFD